MPCESFPWPEEMSVELYALGSEPPPDEPAETESVRAWRQVQQVFAGSSVPLRYVDMARHSRYAYGLRIWDHPTFRVLYGGREIGRTNALFCAGKLRRWMQEVARSV